MLMDTLTEEQIKALHEERAELLGKIDNAKGWGAASTARAERIRGIDRLLFGSAIKHVEYQA